jgi:hypothetical protein
MTVRKIAKKVAKRREAAKKIIGRSGPGHVRHKVPTLDSKGRTGGTGPRRKPGSEA